VTVWVVWVTPTEKSLTGALLTTRLAGIECASEPLVPVIVNEYVPGESVEAVVTVSVELVVDVLPDVGEKLPFAPVGSPVAVRPTEPEKPPLGVIVTV
jgi:hypothetical protein